MAQGGFSMVIETNQVDNLLDQLRTMFEEADKNNDKVLDEGEFSTLMKQFMPNASQDELQGIFRTLDTEGTGEIPYMELLETGFFTEFLEQSNSMLRTQMKHNRQQTVDVNFDSHEYRSEEMEERFHRMEERITKLQQYKDDVGRVAERKVEELNYQVEILQEKQHHKELENAALQDELENLRSESESLRDSLETLREVNTSHKEELDELNRDRENASDVENQLHEYKSKYRAEQARNQSLNEKLSDMIKANAQSTTMVNSLQGQIRASQREFDRLSQSKIRVEDRLVEMKAKYETQYQETQEWMQMATDLERELEDARDDFQTELTSVSNPRQGTVRLDVNNDLFQMPMRGDTGREFADGLLDDLLDMNEDSLSRGQFVDVIQDAVPEPNKTPEPSNKAKSNWARLQTTLQAANAVKKFQKTSNIKKSSSARRLLPPVGKPAFSRGNSDMPVHNLPALPDAKPAPAAPALNAEQIAQLVADVLLPQLTARIDEKTTGITDSVARVVEQEFESMKVKEPTDNPFDDSGLVNVDIETRTPAPSFADPSAPTSNEIPFEDDPFANATFDPVMDDSKLQGQPADDSSLQLISDDLKSVRTFLEGTSVARTAQDRVLDRILSEVMSMKTESKESEPSKNLDGVIEAFHNGMESLQRGINTNNETTMRQLLTEFQRSYPQSPLKKKKSKGKFSGNELEEPLLRGT